MGGVCSSRNLRAPSDSYMGLVNKLFGMNRRSAKPYVDEGMRFILGLPEVLRLAAWQNGLPSYTPEETAAIQSELSNFQNTANEVMGGEALFHPEAVGEFQRALTATALEGLARHGWKYLDELPEDWKISCSTYLKAWTCNLNPSVLLEMAELFAKAGYKGEARQALQVVLLFPTYSHTYFANDERADKLTREIAEDAQKALAAL
jgi:hypothetical protein